MKIVHLSDLHFGTHDDPAMVEALRETVNNMVPDMVVISGDFTQRATRRQFTEAAQFIRTLRAPCFCVPGNHDVPAYDPGERFFNPYKKYRQYISEELSPVYETPDLVMAGLNSARRALPHWNWANGALSRTQTDALQGIFDPAEPRWTICVFHHPIHKVDEMPIDTVVFGKSRALQVIHDLKIDLVLTGHVHYAACMPRGDAAHQTLYLSASTALSWRRREQQENGFNVITLDAREMKIEIYRWRAGRFQPTDRYTHRRSG